MLLFYLYAKLPYYMLWPEISIHRNLKKDF